MSEQLVSKISNLCDHKSPTSQTDGRTDRRTTCDRKTALCTMHSASRGKNWNSNLWHVTNRTLYYGDGTVIIGGGTLSSGGGTPDRGGGTPFRPVPAEFNHCSQLHPLIGRLSATLAPVERVFSHSGLFIHPHHSRLNHSTNATNT